MSPRPIPVGLLGADYEVADGRFRFKTIYGGAYWDPSLRAPLDRARRRRQAGDFLLAVDGKEIKADSEVYRAFEGTAGKRVELKVGPKADGSGARTVAGRADRRRGRAAQPRLGRGQSPQGPRADQGPRRLRLRAQHGRRGLRLLQTLLLPAGRQGGDHRRRAVQRRRPGGRLLHRPAPPAAGQLLGDALRRADPDAERRDPRPQGHDHRRDRRAPAATCCPGCSASSASASWSASGPGAGWSASSASPS